MKSDNVHRYSCKVEILQMNPKVCIFKIIILTLYIFGNIHSLPSCLSNMNYKHTKVWLIDINYDFAYKYLIYIIIDYYAKCTLVLKCLNCFFCTVSVGVNNFSQRSHSCGEFRPSHIGEEVKICGWVQYKRLMFLIVRDWSGTVQVLLPESMVNN